VILSFYTVKAIEKLNFQVYGLKQHDSYKRIKIKNVYNLVCKSFSHIEADCYSVLQKRVNLISDSELPH